MISSYFLTEVWSKCKNYNRINWKVSQLKIKLINIEIINHSY